MKLIIQIPCLNEEKTLASVLADIPDSLDGIDVIETLVIDDGSSDNTVAVAKSLNVDHIQSNIANLGLARSFQIGIERCLQEGADIIVNTDGDNQYPGRYIADLVKPLVEGRAHICIGDRQTLKVPHFSPNKKRLQRLGSAVVRYLSDLEIPDAVSGFRAISREAAMNITIMSSFSYTIEMLIQAGSQKLIVQSIPITPNNVIRESRLFSSNKEFVSRAFVTIVRAYTMYRPLRTFSIIGLFFCVIGVLPIIRFLFYYYYGAGDGHIQSLVLGSTFLLFGCLSFLLALVADIISQNRKIMHEVLVRTRKMQFEVATEKLPLVSNKSGKL